MADSLVAFGRLLVPCGNQSAIVLSCEYKPLCDGSRTKFPARNELGACVSSLAMWFLFVACAVTWPTSDKPLFAQGQVETKTLSRIRVSDDGRGFVTVTDGKRFTPWGFNYDHDRDNRLLEDYWNSEWESVAADFREMKSLGANAVRIHLQFSKFMDAVDKPNAAALHQLGKLLQLAERTRLYVDLTGLGCYHQRDVPGWYDDLDEAGRWQAQANFWRAVAERCKSSPAVFCYDLMNEPVVPGGMRKPREWLGPPFGDKYFVQFITLDQANRPRPEIARAWTRQLVQAIREVDTHHLVTVGLVDWSLNKPGLTSGFEPAAIVPEVDFLCVHLYPERGKVEAAIETLRGFACGKPLVIEETFPLKCDTEEFERFVKQSSANADGWFGFYWGKTLEESRRANTIPDAIFAKWLEFFSSHTP
ncbi:MAG: hypothetical protein RIS70_4452 [Planctomycetota bacterium]